MRPNVAFWLTVPPAPQYPVPTVVQALPAVATYVPAAHVALHDAMPACDAAVVPLLV